MGPTLPGRPRVSTRSAISGAALRLFRLHGFEGTSVDEIASTAGIGRSTFFNYFSSKADAVWSCQEHQLRHLEDRLRLADRGDPFETAARAVIEMTVDIGPEEAEATADYGEVIDNSPRLRLEAGVWAARRSTVIARYVSRRLGLVEHDLLPLSYAHALNGAIGAASVTFGRSRGRRLSEILAESIAPVSGGFAAAWRDGHP